MVGFLSEQRVISIDCGDNRRATLLDIACRLEHARRNRAWRAPQPYEAAICVYVNIATGRKHVMGSPTVPGNVETMAGWKSNKKYQKLGFGIVEI